MAVTCSDSHGTVRIAIDVAASGWGVRDGRPVQLSLTNEGDIRHTQPGNLDVFATVPDRAELTYAVSPDSRAEDVTVSIWTDDGEHRGATRQDASGVRHVSLAAIARQEARIRLTNRSSGPVTWIRPRVTGSTPTTAALLPVADRAAARYNVLLYVIDTLRADHLSCYGYERETSPRIDAFAARATRFTHAYAMASSTWRSMTSLLASRHPSELRSHLAQDAAPDTLAEVFQRAGWQTAAFVANLILRRSLGFARGFDRYDVVSENDSGSPRVVRSEVLHQQALAWLRQVPRSPFFLWIQPLDVHEYDPPPPFRGRFNKAAHGQRTDGGVTSLRDRFAQLMRMNADNYDETIEYADYQFGRFLDALDELGVLDDTIVILTSDHGEPLGEHDTYFHGVNLFEEVVHVPLIISLPWDRDARVVDDLTSLLDLAPTVADLARLTAPDSWQGRSWLLARPPTLPSVAVGAQQDFRDAPPSWFLRTGPWKVVMDARSSRLFHLPTDPDELTDVAADHPVVAAYLTTLLVSRSPAFRTGWRKPPAWNSAISQTDQDRVREALKALGYSD